MALGVEKADHSFRLLKGLNESVQQEPIEASIPKSDAIFVMLDEGVHENLQCGQIPGSLPYECLLGLSLLLGSDGYQGEALAS
jgi:hypothetical protein